MSGHALEVLEFERVLERVARRASSAPGRERVLSLRPRVSRSEVVRELERVAAVMRFLEERPGWTIGPIPDVRAALEELATEGAVLEAIVIHRMGVLMTTSRLTKAELVDAGGSAEELRGIGERLHNLRRIEEEIARSVDAEGSVLSGASRELGRIRDSLKGARARAVRALERYLASLPERFAVPDSSVTIRDGRYVVPVRREGLSEVGGIVHGESQTGATLYVEPPAAIELMNRLRDLEGEESREIRRVLRALSGALATEQASLVGALDALAELDGLVARARAGSAWNGTAPEISEEGERGLRIRDGRHPLLTELGEGTVVPFDLDLEATEQALVVSGPNTGGKSVFLKATGLIAALAQSGVVPPVGAGTRLPLFTSIFADIGDEQSIARNLSTFAAHLANLSEIVSGADDSSLVLIDEMGTGTDPAEGAALARAVLEELVARGATTLVTSHLGDLKRLDAEGSGIVNASLQFDSDRMEPTYRLLKGRPGRSYGLVIARRLGFPTDVLDRAEAYRERGGAELDDLLARLEGEEREARELAHRLDLERTRADRLRAELDDRERTLRAAEQTAEQRARRDARNLLLEARSEVEEAISELRGAAAAGQGLEEASREARRRVERAVTRQRERSTPRRARRGGRTTISPGDPVLISSTGSRGRVVEVRSDRAWVEAGALRLEVPVRELEILELDEETPRSAPRVGGWRGPHGANARPEVDLRGLRVDEVDQELGRALDDALLGDLSELRIIHGKGTGALRQRVAELLEGDPRVSGFRMGAPNEGGAGVTVASLRT